MRQVQIALTAGVLFLAALFPMAGSALIPTNEVEAKVSYGPCVDYIFWQWRESYGELGVDWMARKMWANCDPKDGDWKKGPSNGND